MKESFVEKQGLLPELLLARKDNGETGSDNDNHDVSEDLDTKNLDEQEVEVEEQKHLDKCATLHKTITAIYKKLLSRVQKSYMEETCSRVDAESRDNLPMQVYEERRQNLTKRINLLPIFRQLLKEESAHEEGVEKRKSLGKDETAQDIFDEELGMESARLQGKVTDRLMVDSCIALLRFVLLQAENGHRR